MFNRSAICSVHSGAPNGRPLRSELRTVISSASLCPREVSPGFGFFCVINRKTVLTMSPPKGKTHTTIDRELGQPDDPRTMSVFEFLRGHCQKASPK